MKELSLRLPLLRVDLDPSSPPSAESGSTPPASSGNSTLSAVIDRPAFYHAPTTKVSDPVLREKTGSGALHLERRANLTFF